MLKRLRGKVKLVAYSLPGEEDPIRRRLYRSVRGEPTEADRAEGRKRLAAKLKAFDYRGQPLPTAFPVSAETPTIAYLRVFPGLDAGPKYDPKGFWELPIPVTKAIEVAPHDVVFYDGEYVVGGGTIES